MLSIRPWKLSDAAFVCYTRNNPELMQWFRQDKPITLEQQKKFMASHPLYEGYIIEANKKAVGVIALHYHEVSSPELCIAAPLKYHASAIKTLIKQVKPLSLYGEVFALNPALPVYLNLGFKVGGVRERAYWKNHEGFVDTITIWYESPDNFIKK